MNRSSSRICDLAVTVETKAWVLELFEDLGDVSARAMMGGLAIYCRGQIFALYGGPENCLFLKATDRLAGDLASAGSRQFSYTNKFGKEIHLGYWSLPDTAVDDAGEACGWAVAR